MDPGLAASIDLGTAIVVGLALLAFVGLIVRALAAPGAPPPGATAPEAPPSPAVAPQAGDAPEADADAPAEIDPAVALEGLWRAEEDPDRETEGEDDAPRLRPVDALIEVLRGGESRACEAAIEELVRHGDAAVPALTAALEDPDADVRVDARKALQRIQQG